MTWYWWLVIAFAVWGLIAVVISVSTGYTLDAIPKLTRKS